MTTTDSTTTPDAEPEAMLALSKQARAIRYVQNYSQELFGRAGQLSLNTRSGRIRVGDGNAEMDKLVVLARARLGFIAEAVYTPKKATEPVVVEVTRDDMRDAIAHVAGADGYDPVRRYLESLPDWDGRDRSQFLLDCLNVAEPKPLHRAMLRRTLIAAVARVYQPGVKVDNICVLHASRGGEGKSTFWRTLFGGDDFFSDSRIDLDSKDGMQKIDRHWIHEWSEMAALKSNSSAETIKAFLSSQRDDYRPPYGREIVSHNRRSLFVGTTNDGVILKANGGNRRFWIIPDVGAIDLEWVKENQVQMLAQALAEYRGKALFHLTPEEEAELHEDQKEMTHEAPGTSFVVKFIEGKDAVTAKEIVTRHGAAVFCGMGQPSERGAEMKVGDILKGLGWRSGRRGPKQERYYARPRPSTLVAEVRRGGDVFGVAKFH